MDTRLFLWMIFSLSIREIYSSIRILLVPNQGLMFCKQCIHPKEQGSFVSAWDGYNTPTNSELSGKLVYAVPNDATDDLLNYHQTQGNFVLIDRGKIPIMTKVQRAQDAGAIGVIIADNGECDDDFQCGVLGSPETNRFLEQDDLSKWKHILIPSVLVSKDSGERMKSEMKLIQMYLDEYGDQYLIE